jgi:hypothetical protein
LKKSINPVILKFTVTAQLAAQSVGSLHGEDISWVSFRMEGIKTFSKFI